MNKIFLMGRLVANPEMRYTSSNIPVASFRLAVGRRFKNDETDFIDIVAWRSSAEFACKWFTKGQRVLVIGSLQIRPWKDKDGNNRYSTEVVAEELHFADSKPQNMGAGGNQYAQPQYPQAPGAAGYPPPPLPNYDAPHSEPPRPPDGQFGADDRFGADGRFGGDNRPGDDSRPGADNRSGADSRPVYNESSFSDLLDDDEELPF